MKGISLFAVVFFTALLCDFALLYVIFKSY